MIFNDLKSRSLEAFKARDSKRRAVLNFLISEIQNEAMKNESEDRDNPSDELTLSVLYKAVKTKKENIQNYTLNRSDLIEDEEYELGIIQEFLPKQLSEAEIRAEIEKIRQENPELEGIKLMPVVSKKLKGIADMKVVKDILEGKK
jgi:hypothetical protein